MLDVGQGPHGIVGSVPLYQSLLTFAKPKLLEDI